MADTRRRGELFSPTYPSSKVRWWHESIGGALWNQGTYRHFDVLREMVRGRSAEETVALSHCYDRVVNEGARSASGLWCVCLSEDSPMPAEARGSVGSDGFSSLLTVKADLEKAANRLPISWTSTQAVFETQGRIHAYRVLLTQYRRNRGVREIDRWLEPRDPETRQPVSRALAYWLMSRALGGVKDVCDVTRITNPAQKYVYKPLLERDVFPAPVPTAAETRTNGVSDPAPHGLLLLHLDRHALTGT